MTAFQTSAYLKAQSTGSGPNIEVYNYPTGSKAMLVNTSKQSMSKLQMLQTMNSQKVEPTKTKDRLKDVP